MRHCHLSTISRVWETHRRLDQQQGMTTESLEELIGRRQWDDVLRRIELARAGGTTHDNEARETDTHGYLPLHQACFLQPPIEVVKALIDAYPDAVTTVAVSPVCARSSTSYSVQTSGGRCMGNDKTALHVLSFHGGPVDVLQLLLSLYPQALEQSESLRGMFPLHCACAGTAVPSVVEALLHACPRIVQVATSRTGETPLHLVVQAASDTAAATLESFRLIFNAHPEAASVPAINDSAAATNYYRELFGSDEPHQKRGPLPLHYACRRPSPSMEIIESLLKAHPQAAATPDDMGRLPLHICCMFQDKVETARHMIKAYPEGLLVRDAFGRLPLHLAWMDLKSPDLVWELLRACPDSMYAARADDDDDEHDHFDNNCDIDNEMEEDDENCTCPSCRRRRCPFRIIDDIPLSPRFRGDLRLFVKMVYPDNNTSKDPDDDDDNDGIVALRLAQVVDKTRQQLPLHIACTRVAPVGIVEAMCDLFPQALCATDVFGRLPLHCACSGGIEATSLHDSSLSPRPREQDVVLEKFPQPPLSPDVISLLVERNGVALRTHDKNGMVPFHVACFSTASSPSSSSSSSSNASTDASRRGPVTTSATVEALFLLLRESPDVLSSS